MDSPSKQQASETATSFEPGKRQFEFKDLSVAAAADVNDQGLLSLVHLLLLLLLAVSQSTWESSSSFKH